MTNELLALYNGIFYNLWNSSPILSGNMKKGIKVKSVKDNEIVIEIIIQANGKKQEKSFIQTKVGKRIHK